MSHVLFLQVGVWKLFLIWIGGVRKSRIFLDSVAKFWPAFCSIACYCANPTHWYFLIYIIYMYIYANYRTLVRWMGL